MEAPLNNSEAAKAIGISPVTLAHLRSVGRSPAYVRYRQCDIEAFQTANLIDPDQARAGDVAR